MNYRWLTHKIRDVKSEKKKKKKTEFIYISENAVFRIYKISNENYKSVTLVVLIRDWPLAL